MDELIARRLGNVHELVHLGTQNILERHLALVGDNLVHFRATTLLKTLHLVEQLLLLVLVPDIIPDGRHQHGANVLGGVG